MSNKAGVGTLLYSIDTNRVLLNLRSPHKTHGMCWSLWGGMINEGEVPIDALMRELSEEMGLLPDIIKHVAFDMYQSPDGHFKYYSFVSAVRSEFIPILNSESCGYAWVDLGVWPKPMHAGAKASFCNQRALHRLNDITKDINLKK